VYTPQLGLAPAVAVAIVQDAPAILSGLDKLFGDTGSYDQTHARLLQWASLILNDPVGAVSGNYTPGDNSLASAANAYLWLQCAAGVQSVLPTYRRISGDPASNGCGFETNYGGRADAQNVLNAINQQLNRPAPVESSAPIPSNPSSGVTPSGGTVYTNLPGGISVGLPVPTSTLTTATLFGVPIWALGLGIGVLAFSGGRRGRA
jgi:hypothetical protein